MPFDSTPPSPTDQDERDADTTIVGRLRQLASLHRTAVLRKASARLDITWPPESLAEIKPSEQLDTLAVAEHPTQPIYRAVRRDAAAMGIATPAVMAAEIKTVLGDMDWRMAQTAMSSAKDLRFFARMEADTRLTARRAGSPFELVMENAGDVAEAAAIAAEHGALVQAAGHILDGLDRVIPRSHLAALEEETVCDMARARATAARDGYEWRARLAQSHGRPVPTLTPTDLRARDEGWHRRQIRRDAGRTRQHLAAALGTTGKGGASYADDYSLARWKERQARQKAWAETHTLTGADGTKVPMSEITRATEDGQRARLYVMTLAIEEIAERRGLVPLFLTLTLPPEWHPNPKQGRKRLGPALAPHKGDKELQRRWALFRALLASKDIGLLGLRVVEPHEDGCAHLHALVYVEESQVEDVDQALQHVCPEPTPPAVDDAGNPIRVASKLVIVDREIASPASYIATYILMTCRGAPTAEERAGDKTGKLEGYERVRATASERGWRRFSFLGVHGVQRVWQRLLTTKELPADAPPRVRTAWDALQAKEWGTALEALGALGPRDEGVGLAYATTDEQADPATGDVVVVPLMNAYGEPTRRPAWVEDRATGWRMPLTRQKWEIIKENRNDISGLTVAVSYPSSGADAPSSAPADAIGMAVADDLARLIGLREVLPQWQAWAVEARLRLGRLRGPPGAPAAPRRQPMLGMTG